MKTLLQICSLSALAFSLAACVGGQKNLQIDENLPPLKNVKTLSGMRQIAFEWEPIYDLRVLGYKIYRAKMGDEMGSEQLVATINDRYTTHYNDSKLEPASKYLYTLASFSETGQSAPVQLNAQTLARIDALPFVQAIAGLPNKIKIIWRPHPDPRVVKYRVYKQAANSSKWSKIATVPGRLSAEYIDNIKPNEFAKYKVSAVGFNGVESEPSEVTQGASKILPPVITSLMATTNVPKKIILSWDAPSYEDFDHFDIYEAKSKFLPFLRLASTTKNSFEHELDEDGVVREYYVLMVDKDGLASPRPKVNTTGMSLAKPKSPVLTAYKLLSEGQIEITWLPQDERAKTYAVLKNGEQIATSAASSYVDNDYQNGDKYQIVAIDEFGIASKPSQKLSVSR